VILAAYVFEIDRQTNRGKNSTLATAVCVANQSRLPIKLDSKLRGG